jgi:hypothetical protein
MRAGAPRRGVDSRHEPGRPTCSCGWGVLRFPRGYGTTSLRAPALALPGKPQQLGLDLGADLLGPVVLGVDDVVAEQLGQVLGEFDEEALSACSSRAGAASAAWPSSSAAIRLSAVRRTSRSRPG